VRVALLSLALCVWLAITFFVWGAPIRHVLFDRICSLTSAMETC
jgi:hypothetical protein